jgi:hypothetical protein
MNALEAWIWSALISPTRSSSFTSARQATGGDHWIEVARYLPLNKISLPVTPPGFDNGKADDVD